MILGKDVQVIKEQLENINKQLPKLSELDKLSAVENKFELLEKHIETITLKFSEELSKIKEELNAIKTAREEIQKSARSFNETRQSIERFAHEKFGTIIKDSIAELKIDTDNYRQVKSDLNIFVSQLNSLASEIAKFKAISEQIKQSDFELARYAKEVTKMDSEKIELMKENDNLKSLIAKMRRIQKPMY